MEWINYVLIALIAAGVAGGVVSVIKHAKGKGACCGGGGGIIDSGEKKTLEGPAMGKYVFHIEGMHCENCKRAVERRLDRFEGVVADVDLKHKTATVTCDRPVDVEQLRLAVAMLDYQVTAIETQEV